MERKDWKLVFAVYCGLMVCLLFGRVRHDGAADYWQQVAGNLNLYPLHTVRRYLRLLDGTYSTYLRRHAAANLAGNVVMFLPLGFLPPLLWKGFRPLWRCLLRCGAIITAVELIQLFTLVGSCDVDDLLLNLLGVALGYGLHRLLPGEPQTTPGTHKLPKKDA